jgi:hypothetical protein
MPPVLAQQRLVVDAPGLVVTAVSVSVEFVIVVAV